MTEKRVCLGKIVAAHGLRGEVKVHSYTDNPADIDKYGMVEDKEAAHKFKIKAVMSNFFIYSPPFLQQELN